MEVLKVLINAGVNVQEIDEVIEMLLHSKLSMFLSIISMGGVFYGQSAIGVVIHQ